GRYGLGYTESAPFTFMATTARSTPPDLDLQRLVTISIVIVATIGVIVLLQRRTVPISRRGPTTGVVITTPDSFSDITGTVKGRDQTNLTITAFYLNSTGQRAERSYAVMVAATSKIQQVDTSTGVSHDV